MGRGNQYIQLVKVLYCKLPQLQASTVVEGFKVDARLEHQKESQEQKNKTIWMYLVIQKP